MSVPGIDHDRDPADEARRGLQAALYEAKRAIVGQDAMLERVFVALLAGGHVLLEGVPGLAKTLTVRTLARVLGGSFSRVQFTPDLVPSDLVGTRIWRPDHGDFRTELGPVFANLLLADEINRAPAKVQSALLEVMQEQQVTIAGQAYAVPRPFLVLATQNPIESEGTYQLPEAQVDRFLFKLVVDYPAVEDEVRVLDLLDGEPVVPRAVLAVESLLEHRRAARAVYVDRTVKQFAVQLVDATRSPASHGMPDPPASSSTARARARRSGSCRARRRSRCCAAGPTRRPPMCATSRPTSCATASCSRTTRSPTTCRPTR
jgi:MoxR-like ATPase